MCNSIISSIAFISLGSNMGDPVQNLSIAREHVSRIPHSQLLRSSSIYYTEPQGVKEQPWFANQVIKVAVQGFSPITFLQELLKIEILMGRKREIRWGPRVIDLDLLIFDREVSSSPYLTLPHPRMLERAFVMVPLLEIAPNLVLPTGEVLEREMEKIEYRQKGCKIWQK